MSHTYRITAEKLGLPEGSEPVGFSFEFTNHDDIAPLIEIVKTLEVLPEDEAAQFVLGLKLFGAIHMAHRREPLFEPLHAHFLDFMKRLKANAPARAGERQP